MSQKNIPAMHCSLRMCNTEEQRLRRPIITIIAVKDFILSYDICVVYNACILAHFLIFAILVV